MHEVLAFYIQVLFKSHLHALCDVCILQILNAHNVHAQASSVTALKSVKQHGYCMLKAAVALKVDM